MADWKQSLESLLDLDRASASGLDAEARTGLQDAVAEASASQEVEALLQDLDARFPQRVEDHGLVPARAYARGRTLLALERAEEALATLLPLCEKLEQQAAWEQLAQVADELLEETNRIEAARYLAKAIEEGGAEVAPNGSLRRALDHFPDEHRLCWLVAEQYEREGNSERALGLFAGCLPALIEGREREKIEEVFLRLEEFSDAETILLELRACLKLIGMKEWSLAENYLEPLLPKIKQAGLARDAWDQLLKVLPKTPADSALRRFLRDLAPEALADVDGVTDLLARSGLLDASVKAETAIKKLAELFEFAPGYRVLHHGWGVGRIRVNEGNALIIDFSDKPRHRMSISIARNALQVIPADDLRVLAAEAPERVTTMVREAPTDLAFLAIRELGGKATAQQMRRRLTPEPVPTSRWSTWWKEARNKMDADERFDMSESFRQTYAIRTPGSEEDVDQMLPRLDRRRGIRANLNLLRRFLDQHPQHGELAVRMYTPLLTRWLRDEHTHPEAAMAICLLLRRWERLDPKDLRRSLRTVLSSGVEAAAYADEGDQRFMVTNAFEVKDLQREAVLFALGSRYESIRALALEKLSADPAESEALLTELLSRPEERALTAMSLIQMMTQSRERPRFLPSPWMAPYALARMIEQTGRDVLRNQALRLFKLTSSLARALEGQPAPEEVKAALADLLSRWRASERYLFPILTFLEEMGLAGVAAEVQGMRSAATNAFLRTPGNRHTYEGIFLTRPTYERLEKERDRLAWELKTDVAQAIARAREMGDLSENAEYDAAKEKQAKHAERISAIGDMLSKATMIGSVEVPANEVGPGSRVLVRRTDTPDAEPRTIWLLGEDDTRFGPEVVSCAAPIGQALLGRRVGEQVELKLADDAMQVEIIATELKVPEREPAAGSPR